MRHACREPAQGRLEYLIKWRDSRGGAATWEPAHHIHDPATVADFEYGSDRAAHYTDWVWVHEPFLGWQCRPLHCEAAGGGGGGGGDAAEAAAETGAEAAAEAGAEAGAGAGAEAGAGLVVALEPSFALLHALYGRRGLGFGLGLGQGLGLGLG